MSIIIIYDRLENTNQKKRMNGSCGYGRYIGGAADISLFADNGRVKNRESV